MHQRFREKEALSEVNAAGESFVQNENILEFTIVSLKMK